MRAINAVLFDLDGTLADSAPDLAAALNRVRADQGLAAVPAESLRGHSSAGARGLILAGLQVRSADPRFPALRDAFLAHYERGLAVATQLFDGIASMLDGLDARRLQWGIVTNKVGRYTAPVVAHLGLDARAAVVVSGDTTPNYKPHPEPLLYAADRMRIDPTTCLYVGDDRRDIDAGMAAGMRTLVARWGYLGIDADPDAWPADGWLDTPGDLLRFIDDATSHGDAALAAGQPAAQ